MPNAMPDDGLIQFYADAGKTGRYRGTARSEPMRDTPSARWHAPSHHPEAVRARPGERSEYIRSERAAAERSE
jgi:hypothetical protein